MKAILRWLILRRYRKLLVELAGLKGEFQAIQAQIKLVRQINGLQHRRLDEIGRESAKKAERLRQLREDLDALKPKKVVLVASIKPDR